MAPAHLHCVRHAQGYHNLTPDNHRLVDPALTDLGKQQCADLHKSFPHHDRITHIVASPIKRTLWTALLGFAPAIANSNNNNNNIKVIALPELQEISDLPCDTGSDLAELEREFAGQPVDLSRVEEGWNSKSGRWAATAEAVAERTRLARVWLRELAGEDGEVVVVTHGGLLHHLTQDWSGFDLYGGTGWKNVEYRTYTFLPDDTTGNEAPILETPESNTKRGASPFSDDENLKMKEAANSAWLGENAQHQAKNLAPGPAIQEVGLEAVKSQA